MPDEQGNPTAEERRSQRAQAEQQLQEDKRTYAEQIKAEGTAEGSPEYQQKMDAWMKEHQAALRSQFGESDAERLQRSRLRAGVGTNIPREEHQALIDRVKNIANNLGDMVDQEDREQVDRAVILGAALANNVETVDEAKLAAIATYVETANDVEKKRLVDTIDMLLH